VTDARSASNTAPSFLESPAGAGRPTASATATSDGTVAGKLTWMPTMPAGAWRAISMEMGTSDRRGATCALLRSTLLEFRDEWCLGQHWISSLRRFNIQCDVSVKRSQRAGYSRTSLLEEELPKCV
jgi:hypothetical protein